MKIDNIKKYSAPLGLAFLAMAAVPAAHAASLVLDDSVEGEVTVSTDRWFEFGGIANGTPFAGRTSVSVTKPGEVGTFTGTWWVNIGGTPDPGSGIIYIVEPGTTTVSDRIEADWSTEVRSGLDKATINVTVTSSACGDDLGLLPDDFSGVNEPQGAISIGSSFLDPITGNPVSIPSNLGMRFVSIVDSDCDGVVDVADYCPDTVIPEVTVPSSGELGINRYALVDGDGVFDTTSPNGDGPQRNYTIEDTGGCSCEQIIDELGLGGGQTKRGCSDSNMAYWIDEYLP